jgi:hypothetical protein
LAVDRPLQKVHPNRLWLGLKKSRNKLPSKMICIEVMLPGAFDSNHTTYVNMLLSIQYPRVEPLPRWGWGGSFYVVFLYME